MSLRESCVCLWLGGMCVQLDNHHRGTYGVKDKKLAELFVQVYCLDPHSEKAQRLLNWKAQGLQGKKMARDRAAYFSDVVFEVAQDYGAQEPSLSIADINSFLDRFVDAKELCVPSLLVMVSLPLQWTQ